MEAIDWTWLSLEWFSYELLFNDYEYRYKTLFYVSLIAPFVVFSLLILKGFFRFTFSRGGKVAITQVSAPWSLWFILKIIPDFMISLFVGLLFLALAGPQKSEEHAEQFSKGIDIMLVLDVSPSMDFKDFKPNRLEQVKRVAQNFIENRKTDRIGVIEFAGVAYSRTPLTTDKTALVEQVRDISLKDIEEEGTAIGNALALATFRMKNVESRSKIVILISDGESNAGNIDPETAALDAANYDIKLYTIGVGSNGKVLAGYQTITSFFGQSYQKPQYVNNTLDEKTLKKIAKIGEGEYFHAKNKKALEQVFEKINEYEKSEIRETHYKTYKNFYDIYLKLSLIPFFIWLFFKSTFITSALID